MKKLLFTILSISCTICASCQEIKSKTYELEATVVDQDGSPVENATVKGSSERLILRDTIPQGEYVPTHVKTDSEGKAKLSLLRYSEWPSGVLVEKNGYYTTRQKIEWPPFKNGDNRTQSSSIIQLKKIMNPTRMYAHSNSGSAEKIVKIKQFNVKYGFDLQYAEALPPLGNGKHADFYFILEGDYKSKYDYNMTLKIMFTNKSDGVVAFDTASRLNPRENNIQGSSLQSDYTAPESNYKQSIIKKTWSSKNDSNPQCDNDMRKNYYFRVRTITDEDGKLVSANYGKIYGDFFFEPANIEWGYYASLMLVDTYFNPSINVRNVEFDTGKNLLKNSDVIHP
jgi:hypothetical protein